MNFFKGDKGIELAEQFCLENNLTFEKASKHDDLTKGIDVFINSKPTDVKYTNSIFFLNYLIPENRCSVRHPFRNQTEATHYLFVNLVNNKVQGNHVEIGNILVQEYFKDLQAYKEFKTILEFYDKKDFKTINNAVSLSQFCFKAKTEHFLPLLKTNITLSYSSIEDDKTNISFSFYKSKTITPVNKSKTLDSLINEIKTNKNKFIKENENIVDEPIKVNL